MPDARLVGYDAADISRLRNVMDETATGQLNFLHKTAGSSSPSPSPWPPGRWPAW